jgi:hypothetical protein
MKPHEHSHLDDLASSTLDRTDAGGPWSKAVPLIALALIGLILVRACVVAPAGPPATAVAPGAPGAQAPR